MWSMTTSPNKKPRKLLIAVRISPKTLENIEKHVEKSGNRGSPTTIGAVARAAIEERFG